ncbi:MAG TPA: 3'(2'),5'-bisphosphate nucleotidase CysQ, partial [Bryobacteraceae bacterium]|nr:3'(2'),5'-bisphosphate nucleotidase CysQ [Bryobacteraceae bacterium]
MRAREDLALIEEAVREAGKIARSYFGGSYKKWDKGKGDPVTEADLAIDKYLRETFTASRPDYGWLSEESADDLRRLSTEYTFVVDPIDGTVAFLKGRPHFTISVALVRDHLPCVGVVFNPITDECFTAIADEGAMMNGARIHASGAREVDHCRMLADRAMLSHPGWNNPPLTPWPPMEIETRGSIAYRLALVANGSFDAMLALSAKRDWDLAAGDLIVREAGGRVTTHTGAPMRYNGSETLQ